MSQPSQLLRPRANTLGVLVRDSYILLEEQTGRHSGGTDNFYRPIGGTIELGERSDETLIREYQEEINAKIEIKSYIACLENIYTIENVTGHEITQLYEVKFMDHALYQKEEFQVTEPGKTSTAKWIPLQKVLNDEIILYPIGLKEILQKNY
ncbi:hypothetical protein FIU87_19815 [Bacillus sp. THAF10]|uniref:NUDIX hydrolase n=1 Tax=Bacillus sp. THAF10 TaxID=2587848 RepID=UPI0012A84DF6|nr:NUDIX hydrolase [Bacillus sp. THAF10]QFT90897.1 hypothetical protein FIU87_19815 [Bacillus sp. THAF10]